jgi:hypothetical protein
MKTVLQVLFGLVLGVTAAVVTLYLGLLINGQPDWRTGAVALLLLATTQGVSFLAFRHRIAVQVLFGSFLCMAIAVWLIYSSRSFFWEAQYPDGSSPITWRSDVVFLLLLVVTQAISFFIFRTGTAIHRSSQQASKKESSKR